MAPKKEDHQPIVLDQEIESFPPEESQRFDSSTTVVANEESDQHFYSSQSQELPADPSIVDKYNFVYFSFGLMGVMMILPFSVVMTATNFWMYKFRTVNGSYTPDDDSNRNDLQTFFESNIFIYNNLFFLITLLINIYIGHLIRPKIRLYFSLFLTFIVFCVITWFATVNTDDYQKAFFSIVMGLVILLSISSAIFQSTMLGIMSLFPPKYISACIISQTFSGLLASLIQLLTLIKKMEAQKSALYFFLSTDILILITVVIIIFVRKTKYYKYYSKMALNSNSNKITQQSINGDSIASYHPESDSLLRFILRKNRIYFISITMVSWATLSVYPPLTILIVARDPHLSPWDGRFFTTVVCFCLYNLSDMAGRIVASLVPFPDRKSSFLLVVSILRWALVPLLMLCNAQPRIHLPVYFLNEIYVAIFIVLLGLTNGHVFMASVANTSEGLPPHMHETNGFVLTLVMGTSVVLGALSSNLVLRLL